MHRLTVRTILLLGLFTALGCAPESPSQAPADPKGFQEVLGCLSVTQKPTEELYAQDHAVCQTADGEIDVYTFASPTARDSWRKIAEEFGSKVTAEGATWVAVE